MANARPSRRRRGPEPAGVPVEAPVSGRALPLLAQYDYTAGGCAPFARAALTLLGGTPALLYALEPEQFEQHDHPRDIPLCLHAFALTKEGLAIDAEGIRPVRELARGFGVREGWSYRIAEGQAALDAAFPDHHPDVVAEATALMEEHGWRHGVPQADESLRRHWREVRVMREERAGRKRVPTPEELRLYSLVPGHEVESWNAFERLEIREHADHAFVVVAVPRHPEDDELIVTAAADLDAAEELACDLQDESGLDFDLDASPCPR